MKTFLDKLKDDSLIIFIVLMIPALVLFLLFFFWASLAVFFFLGLVLWVLFTFYYTRILFRSSMVFRVFFSLISVALIVFIVYQAGPHFGL